MQSKSCPSCNHRFVPWKVWLITRYSSIPCPDYGVRLIRHIDVQFFGVVLLEIIEFIGLYVLTNLYKIQILSVIILGVILISVAWILDALTVRLVIAGKWRGIFGYENM